MANQLLYPFTDPLNYQTLNAEVTAGVGKAALSLTAPSYSQTYSSATGFTYNAARTEFISGLMRQKFNPPAGATLFANYDSNADANWGQAILSATLIGSPTPTVSGGFLNMNGANPHYAYYSAASGNANFTSTGTVRFSYRPNYTGSPAANRSLFCISAGGVSLNNGIVLYHDTASAMRVTLYNSTGGVITVGMGLGTWVATAGTTYEFEFNFDFATGAHRLFINGVQQGSTLTFVATRTNTATELRLGTGLTALTNVPDASYGEVAVFNTVQHTSAYTPAAMPYPYQSDDISLPLISDVLTTLTSFSATDTNQARYTLNGLWWNGSAWAASSLVWAQANTAAEVLANYSSLTVPILNMQFRVHFPDSHAMSSVDTLNLGYTSSKYVAARIVPYAPFYADDLVSVAATINTTGLDEIRFLIEIDGSWYFFNGSAWAVSNLTKAQTNTLTTFNANIGTAVAAASVCRIVVMIWPDPGTTTPDIDDLLVEYNFNFQNLPAPQTTVVYGFIYDAEGEPVEGATVSFKHDSPLTSYREAEDTIVSKAISTVVTDSDGEFSLDLVPGSYQFQAYKGTDFAILKKASGEKIIVSIPQVQEVNITDQIDF